MSSDFAAWLSEASCNILLPENEQREERGKGREHLKEVVQQRGSCCDTGHGRFVGCAAESGGQWCNEGQIEKVTPAATDLSSRSAATGRRCFSCVSIFFKWTSDWPKEPPMKNDTSCLTRGERTKPFRSRLSPVASEHNQRQANTKRRE